MNTKNCSNCYWWLSTGCENTNWKTGTQTDPTVPVCGYWGFDKEKLKPMSWQPTKVDKTAA